MEELINLISTNSTNSIVEYADKNAERLVGDWAYAANTSIHNNYSSHTEALVKLLQINEFNTLKATSICKSILKDEIKTIYRALTLARPQQTVPTLDLLAEISKFASADLFNLFDFSLSVIRKLVAMQPFRKSFLLFYITLIERSSGPNRRELIGNRKIVSVWFGKLSSEDEEDMVVLSLKTLNKFVLMDKSNFTKSAKMGIFNDWTLRNFLKLLVIENFNDVVLELSTLFETLFCDKVYGVRMIGNGEQKLPMSFFKIIKPWENLAQMDLVIKILSKAPELWVPYFNLLSQTFNLAPKSSMFWVSFCNLHIRALKLDPKKVAELVENKADMSLVVCPPTVSKNHLTQALGQQSAFMKFQAAQVVLFTLRRLRSVIESIYKPQNWDTTILVEDVFSRLPDAVQFSKDSSPDLLKTTFCIILKEMGSLRPLQNIQVNVDLKGREVSRFEFVQVENLLEVQMYTSDQTKWWNPVKGATFSLFTQLLKFSTYNLSLSKQCGQLLNHLVQPTQMFADIDTLASHVDALLFTLSVKHSEITWMVIEQSIQRVIMSPYQYIDKVGSEKVSPFFVALTEQYKSFFKQRELTEVGESLPTQKWLQLFGRSLAVLGEDKNIICTLLEIPELNKECDGGGKDEYFNFILDESDKNVLQRKDLLYKISNPLELAATQYRIVNSSNDKLRTHLLASIPSEFLSVLALQRAGFIPFIGSDRFLIKAFLATIDGNNSPELTNKLEESNDWDLGISRLSTEFLENKLRTENDTQKLDSIISELTKRGIKVPIELLPNLLSAKKLAYNLELFDTNSLSLEDGAKLFTNATSPQLAAQLVRISQFYSKDHKFSTDGVVLVAAAKYCSDKLDHATTLETASSLLENGDATGLSIIVNLNTEITDTLISAITNFIETSKTKNSVSALHSELVTIAVSNLELPFINRWLKIVVHELTKRYAEGKMFDAQYDFLKSFNAELTQLKIWDKVNSNEINSLLEAVLRYDREAISFELISRIALESESSSKTSKLNSLSHLAIFFEKAYIPTTPEIELAEALAIYSLVTVNLDSCSTQIVEQGLLLRFQGSLSAKDQVIYSTLEQIESVRQRSWVDAVESWDIRPARASHMLVDEYEKDPLIMIKSGSRVFVTIDEQQIRESTQYFEIVRPPQLSHDYNLLLSEIQQYQLRAPTNPIYNSSFLLNLVVSCEYLTETPEVFLTSGLLSFVFCCLVDPELKEIALSVLKTAFNQIEEQNFKDKVCMRLLIGKVLTLYTTKETIPSHIPIITGQIALVLSKPGHFLYTLASQWLLQTPSIWESDIPLSKSIISSQSDSPLREIVWLVNALKSGCVDETAIQIYTQSGILEWVLSQFRLLNERTSALKDAIQSLLDRITLTRKGSDRLMTGSAGLAIPEIKETVFYTANVKSYAK